MTELDKLLEECRRNGETEEAIREKIKDARIKEFEGGLPLIVSYQGEAYGAALSASFYSKPDGIVEKEAATGKSCGSLWWYVPKSPA